MWIFYLYSQIFWENRLLSDKTNEYGGKFYSNEYKKSGFHYEVGLCIKAGWIVWINGSYEYDIWLDISIFRNNLLSCLGKDKWVGANGGYIWEAPEFLECPKSMWNVEETEFMQ